MPWKENDDKSLVRDDKGNPIWLNDSGDEKSVDYPAMSTALSTANKEAAERKAKLREAESRLDAVKDIEDLAAWRDETNKAMETVKSLSDKEKDIEGRIRLQVEAATKPLKDQMAKIEQEKAEAYEHLQLETVSNAFSRSEFVRNKLVDPGLAADLFSKNFKLNETGKLVATGHDGQTIYGETGEAGFDEALAKLVDGYSGKDFLLKGSKASGSGATPGSGNSSGRAGGPPKGLMDCKNEAEKIAYIKEHAGGTP